MRKILSFLVAVLFAGSMMAEETVAYTLTPASGSNNSYAGNCDIEIGGITWNLTGNSTMQPWRLGGKSLDGVQRELYSKTAIADNVTKIIVEHGTASGITINSFTVIVASDDAFENVISTLTPAFEASAETTIERPAGADWSNAFYKFVYDVTVTGSQNKFLQFTGAKFYAEEGGDDPTDPTPAEILQGYADDLKAVIDAAGKWNLNVTDLETYYERMVQAIKDGDENIINQYIAYAQNLMAQVPQNVITEANSVLEDELNKLITDEIPADKVQACQEAIAAAIQTAALAWDTNESAAYNLSALEGLVFNKIIPEVEAQIEEILKEGGDDPVSGDITILPTDFTAAENADYSTTKSGVTVAVTASTVTADQMRIFQGKTITLSVASGNITKIVFTCTANGDAKYGPGCLTTEVGSYSFDASGPTGTWEGSAQSITFNTSKQVRATEIVVTVGEGGDVPPVVEDVYTMVGAAQLFGTSWDVTNNNNNMTLVDDESGLHYELVKTGCILAAEVAYELKVVLNHSWDDYSFPEQNQLLYVSEDGVYDVYFQFYPGDDTQATQIFVSTEYKGSAEIVKHYTLVGDINNWAEKEEANLMIADATSSLYTYVAREKELIANTAYGYKVVEFGSWTEYYPNTGDNDYFYVEEDGIYTVTFTFDPENATCTVRTEKQETPVIETITCAEVYNLASGAAVALKEVVVTYRHSSYAYVRDASGEAQGGMLLYLNTETQQTCEWKAGDRLIGVTGTVEVFNDLYEITMTDDQFALISVQEDYAPQAFLVENMTSDEINQYIVIEHVKLEGMFYETGTSTTITSTAPVEINFFNKFHLAATFEEGKSYTIFGVGSIYKGTLQVNFIEAVEEELSGYFVVGSFNKWTPSEEYRLDLNQDQPAYMEWKLSDLKLTEGDELKVVAVIPGEENIWYPASEEGNNHNYIVTKAGTYTIYFRPNGNDDWGYYYFELVKKEEPVTPNLTIAEFIQNEGGKCYLTGVVSDIKKYNDGSYNKYGNFNLTDESGTIYVYGLLTAEGEAQQFANMGVDENDTLTVLAETYEYYQQTTHEVKNAIYVSHKDYVEPVDPSEDVAFYLVGTILESNWEIAESGRYLFEATDVEGEYWLRETLDGGDECKVRGVDVTGAPNGWYPDGLDNNYIVPGESTQPVEIFFRPKGDGGDGWHYGYIFTLPQIRLDGAFTNWENYIVMNVAADKQSASVTIDIEEPGEYQFVLYVGVDGRSLCGEDEYSQYTLTRDRYWANALTYSCEGVGANMALNADVAGTYVAHYEYASGNLWFDFPEKEISAYEVAEAIEAQLTDGEEINVRGVIKNMTFKGTNFAKYGSVCIYVEDATGAEGEFEYFNCYSFNEAKFVYSDYDPESTDWISFDEIYDENGNALHVGDTVIAHGAYKLYNNTKHELNTGCYIVDVIHPTFVPDESENVVVYLLNTLNWNEVYAYVLKEWHSQAYEWCIWPGIAMRPIVAMNAPAKDKANKQDDAVKYRVEFPKAYDKIIFSGMEIDTRYQTEDLQVEAGKTFVLGEWSGQVYTGEWVEDATAIGNINTNTVEAVKVLENGQILIIKNGKIFNITGQIVK